MLDVALGAPRVSVRREIMAHHDRVLWRHWRRAGLHGPLRQIAVIAVLLAADGAAWVRPALLGVIVWLSTAALFAVVVVRSTRLWLGRRLQRGEPGEPTVMWCHDGDQWAFILLRNRPDGSWAASGFVSTGGGIGRELARAGITMADQRQTPLHLTTLGAPMIRYYQKLGFTLDTRPRLLRPTPMTYVPQPRSGRPVAKPPAA